MQKKTSESTDFLLKAYFKQINVFPLLSFEEEQELSKKIRAGDNEALHKMVNSNLRLVVRISGLYSRYHLPVMDMIQEGNLGLINAAKKYDYRKNVRFCTYASYWIRQYMSRYISNKRRIIRLPLRKEETLRRIQNTYNFLCQTLNHQPANADIAKELGMPVKDVESIVNLAADSIGIEYKTSEDQTVNAIDIHEDYTYSPERSVMKQFSRDNTMRVLNKLQARERHVIAHRYQLNGCECRTLREIGDKFDISPETVRQIELKALKKIRNHALELRESLYVEAM